MTQMFTDGLSIVSVSICVICGLNFVTPVTGSSPQPRPHRYLIQLDDPPLAQYRGGIAGLAATAVDASHPLDSPQPEAHLAVDTPAARAYLAFLDARQDRLIQSIRQIAPRTRIDWHYRYAFNGLAATLTPAEATEVMHIGGVKAVQAEEYLTPDLDASVPLVGAPAAWAKLGAGGGDLAGRGVRLAIIDSGTDIDHPFLRDDGMPPPPAGFPAATLHLRGTVLNYPDPKAYTSRKVIAARVYPAPEMVEGLSQAAMLAKFTPFSREHGLIVSGIAAGRPTTALLPTAWGESDTFHLSGVAPGAWLLNYKFDFATTAEYAQGVNLGATPELIAMLEQMVLDKVDVVNLSEGHATFLIDHPSTHPLAQAFDAAADAGIVAVVSAGNAGGNGATSLSGAFKYSDMVLAVGNTTSDGSIDVAMSLEAPGGPPAPSEPSEPPEPVWALPRASLPISRTIAARVWLAPEVGCAADPAVAGKIAVLVAPVLFAPAGTCDEAAMAADLAQTGALAVVYAYDDRATGAPEAPEIPVPSVAVVGQQAIRLLTWLGTHAMDGRAVLAPGVKRGRHGTPDILVPSSSRGPGLDGTLKPDLSAPGTDIWSSSEIANSGGITRTFAPFSGTSLAAPHVAGGAALVRSAHPDWTSAQVRSALISTAFQGVAIHEPRMGGGDAGLNLPDPPRRNYSRAADWSEGGAGRLDLTMAISPGLTLDPAKVSFGILERGATRSLTVTVKSVAKSARQKWRISVIALGGGGQPQVAPVEFTLSPDETTQFAVEMDTGSLTQGKQWGYFRIECLSTVEPGQPTVLTLPYYAEVTQPEARKDVLLVNWSYGDSYDYQSYYISALHSLGLTYDVWWIDGSPSAMAQGAVRAHPPLRTLARYDMVILNTNDSTWALEDPATGFQGAYQYQNYLVQGGNLLLAGQGVQDWWTVRTQDGAEVPSNQTWGCDMCLARYFAGFQFGLTSTLQGRYPNWDDMEVLLRPHVRAPADSPFHYALDISTGSQAKDGAEGNQYGFASGGTLGAFDPAHDHPYTEGVFDRVRPWAQPLWAFEDRAVGTYVAGRQHPEARIRWNAMFWGFGLEGVGSRGGNGRDSTAIATASRDRLLGDTFNFMAHNLWASLKVVSRKQGAVRIGLRLPASADVPLIKRAAVSWVPGPGSLTIDYDPPVPADRAVTDRSLALGPGRYHVQVVAYPVAKAAPLYVEGELQVAVSTVYLPDLRGPVGSGSVQNSVAIFAAQPAAGSKTESQIFLPVVLKDARLAEYAPIPGSTPSATRTPTATATPATAAPPPPGGTQPVTRTFLVNVQDGDTSVVLPDPGIEPERDQLQVVGSDIRAVTRVRGSSLLPAGQWVMSEPELRQLSALLVLAEAKLPIELGTHQRSEVLLDSEFKVRKGDNAILLKQIRPFLARPISTASFSPTLRVQVPADIQLCGTWREGYGVAREWMEQASFGLRAGEVVVPVPLVPTTTDVLTHTLFGALRYGPGLPAAQPAADGEVRVTPPGAPGAGYRVELVRLYRPGAPNGQAPDPRVVEVDLTLADVGAGEFDLRRLDETALTGRWQVTGQVRAGTFPTSPVASRLQLAPCGLALLPRYRITVTLEAGQQVVLDQRRERDDGVSGLAALVGADLQLAAGRRQVTDLGQLVYGADRHHWNEQFWVLSDPPLGDAYGLEVRQHYAGAGQESWTAGVLDAGHQESRALRVVGVQRGRQLIEGE